MKKVVAIFAILTIANASTIPSFFEKCKKDDPKLSDCLTENVNKGWSQFAKANKLNKIVLKEVVIDLPNVLSGTIHEGNLRGFENIVFNNVKIDFKNKSLTAIFSQPLFVFHADDVEIFIDFLGTNLNEKGAGNGTFVDNIWTFSFNYDVVERDGEEYMQIKDPKLRYNTNKLHFELTSTVDRKRGEQVKTLFNNFWRLFNILGENSLAQFFTDHTRPIVEKYLNSVPIKSLFD